MESVVSAPIPNFIFSYSPSKNPKSDYSTVRPFSQDNNENFSARICEVRSDIKTSADKRFKLLAFEAVVLLLFCLLSFSCGRL